PRFIESVHGRGYRFIAPVALEPHAGDEHFVGRQAELARLQSHVARALAGERQVIFVSGEAGIGKSALVRELLARTLDDASASIGFGQCLEARAATEPYLPVLEALGRAWRGPRARHVVRRVRALAPSWLALLPVLHAPKARATPPDTGEGAGDGKMLRELADALDVVTADRPLVLWLDDLHW